MSYQAQRWVEKQDLHRTPKSVLAKIAERANSKSLGCYPSQETLAKDLGLSRRTVGSSIRYLEEQGFLERENRHHRSNGYRKSDLITLRMESVQTLVHTWRTYPEYLADANPSRYVHRNQAESNGNESPVQWERDDGPMGTAFPTMNRKEEQEVRAGSTSTTTTTTSSSTTREAAMHIAEAKEVDGEWEITVVGVSECDSRFEKRLGETLEAGLIAGLSIDTLNAFIQDSWMKQPHWVLRLDDLDRRIGESTRTAVHPGLRA